MRIRLYGYKYTPGRALCEYLMNACAATAMFLFLLLLCAAIAFALSLWSPIVGLVVISIALAAIVILTQLGVLQDIDAIPCIEEDKVSRSRRPTYRILLIRILVGAVEVLVFSGIVCLFVLRLRSEAFWRDAGVVAVLSAAASLVAGFLVAVWRNDDPLCIGAYLCPECDVVMKRVGSHKITQFTDTAYGPGQVVRRFAGSETISEFKCPLCKRLYETSGLGNDRRGIQRAAP